MNLMFFRPLERHASSAFPHICVQSHIDPHPSDEYRHMTSQRPLRCEGPAAALQAVQRTHQSDLHDLTFLHKYELLRWWEAILGASAAYVQDWTNTFAPQRCAQDHFCKVPHQHFPRNASGTGHADMLAQQCRKKFSQRFAQWSCHPDQTVAFPSTAFLPVLHWDLHTVSPEKSVQQTARILCHTLCMYSWPSDDHFAYPAKIVRNRLPALTRLLLSLVDTYNRSDHTCTEL